MFGLESFAGLAIVGAFMILIFVLFCIFGTKGESFGEGQQEEVELEEFMGLKMEDSPKPTSLDLSEIEPHLPQTKLKKPFMPAPKQPVANPLEEETTVLSRASVAKTMMGMASMDEAPRPKNYVSEETMLLSKEVLSSVTQNQLAPSIEARKTELEKMVSQISENSPNVLMPEKPLAFGYKMAWLAIPDVKNSQVIKDLNLQGIQPANWTQGLTAAYEDRQTVFITPNLRGWVLVIGRKLWSKADLNMPVQKIPWFKELAKLYSEAYFFSTMRGLENHGWLKMENSLISRAYGYCGELEEIMWSMGKVTPAEISLDANFAVPFSMDNQVIPQEKDVLKMAAKWTIDTSFADYDYDLDLGFVGKLT